MELSVVVPVYRHEAVLADFHRRLFSEVADCESELIFVNDASPDGSLTVLQSLSPALVIANRFRLGVDRSVLAGLAIAKGRTVVVMSPSDDVEGIAALVERAAEGDAECVFASAPAGLLSTVFGGITGAPRNASLYFALNRHMTDRLLAYRDHDPFVVPMIGCSGMRAVCLRKVRSSRWTRWRTAWRVARLVLRLKTR